MTTTSSITGHICVEIVKESVDQWFIRNNGSVPTYGLDTSLLALGMDSLSAAELALDISEHIGFVVTDELIFDHPSVNDLGRHLAELLNARNISS